VSTANTPAQTIRTTAELADRLGISRWTVSRALNGHPVDPETRHRIEEEARRAGFLPSASARTLRSGRSRIVGAIVHDLENYNLTSKLRQLQEALADAGFHLMLEIVSDSPESEQTARTHLLSMRPVALIRFASLAHRPPGGGAPEILVDPQFGSDQSAVIADRAAAVRLAVRHLRQRGSTKIAILGIDPSTHYGAVRTRALKREVAQQGLSTKSVRQLWHPERELMDERYGYDLTTELGDWLTSKTGIVALNDRIALGALKAVSLRFSAPRIVGYDNSPWTESVSPPLSSVDPGNDQLIAAAVVMLGKLISPDAKQSLKSRKIQPRLVARET